MIEEHENQETSLQDLIDLVERDDLPTNEFTTEDKDPMVILGKLNEVIAYLQTLQATINASDSKANEALQRAIQAVADATQALSVANGIDAKATQALANAIEAVGTANTALSASNTALSTANTAISTANTALSSANDAVETAENALDTAESAETKADTAITTANGAKTTAEGIDAKATTALANSQTAVSTANTAETKAQEALDQVVAGLGTKIYRGSQLLSSLDIKPIEDDIADNTTAITALQNGKVDKVTGKQLSTEDFTTALLNKLNSLYNYDDTQVLADILALQNGKVDKVAGKQLSTEDFTTALLNKLNSLYNYDDTQVQADLSSLSSNKADKNNANQSIVAGSVTAPTGVFDNINTSFANFNTILNQKLSIDLFVHHDTNATNTYYEMNTLRLKNANNVVGSYSNSGIQIVWGRSYAGGGVGRTVTFDYPFADNLYGVSCNMRRSSNTSNGWNYIDASTTKTTTAIRFICGDDQAYFICIGRYTT